MVVAIRHCTADAGAAPNLRRARRPPLLLLLLLLQAVATAVPVREVVVAAVVGAAAVGGQVTDKLSHGHEERVRGRRAAVVAAPTGDAACPVPVARVLPLS